MSDEDRQQLVKRALLEIRDLRARLEAVEAAKHEPVAIIGLGCRFPGGADSPEAFWQLLHEGRDATSELPAGRWEAVAELEPNRDSAQTMSVRRGGFLDQVDQFDPLFFGIPPREAVTLDPQHRLFLEVAWEALEDAGVAPDRLAGSQTGVFLGITSSDYAQLLATAADPSSLDAYVSTGNPFNFAAGRLSYLLGLLGPSLALDTACSSSLTAVYLACQSLRTGASDLALAGGVNLLLSPETTETLTKARMLAADGRCKTFDAGADGYGRGEGCGVVVLKRLSDALSAGDPIVAVIRGVAVNQDGHSSGLTVPNGPAQQRLIRLALADAGLAPTDVDYVEAHGTGTSLGDPIEVHALAAALGEGRAAGQPLKIGSAKTNIGHLEAAAGIAGLIKLALALRHGELPPHLHVRQPNPRIAWDEVPVTIVTAPTPWPTGGRPRIAGVSSFGVSGANAHIIVAEPPSLTAPTAAQAPVPERPLHLLAASAKDATALRQLAERYPRQIAQTPDRLADLCYTANVGRAHFPHRLAVSAASPAEMSERLASWVANGTLARVAAGHLSPTRRSDLVFMFTGQGSQYVGMGRQLYETQPTFRRTLLTCDEILRSHLPQPLLEVLFGSSGAKLLDQTAYTQPALFALEMALAEVWRSWGLTPTAVLGHSVGEYAAACVAGIFSLEDGLRLVAARGRLMQELPAGGAMAALFTHEERAAAAMAPYGGQVAIATLNGPQETVISGEGKAVEQIMAALLTQGVQSRRLVVSHAFHSPLMAPMLAEFAEIAAQVSYQPPRLRVISNVSGTSAGAEMGEASYWVRHISAPVRFSQSIAALYGEGSRLFVEVGPKPVLAAMGQRSLPAAAEQTAWLPSLRAGIDDWQVILESLGALYVRGAAVDWAGFDRDYARTKTAAPTYPFQRQRYWFQPKPAFAATPRAGAAHSINQAGGALLGRRLPSPLRTLQFESELHVNSAAVIGEHRIFGRVVTPGVVYFEMALAAMATVGADDLQLHEVKLVQPLVLEETTSRTVQLLLTPAEGSADVPFQIFSLASGSATNGAEADPAWKLHVEGRLRPGEAANRPALQRMVAVDEMRARCRQEMSGADFYSRLWPADFQLGKHFRRVLYLWRRDGEAIGLVQAGDIGPGAGVRSELLTLDACVQLLVAALPQSAGGAPAVFVGTGQQAAHLYTRTLPPQVWCQARLRGWDDPLGEGRMPRRSAAGDNFAGDLLVFDERGQLLAELAGVRFSRVAAETLRRAAAADASGQQPAQHRLSPAQLASAQPEHRLELARTYLVEAAAAILGMPPDKLEPEQPLVELMDSLMIVELQSRIERDLKVGLPLTTLLDGAGVLHVAVRLLDELAQVAGHSGRNGAGPGLNGSRRWAEAADPPLPAGVMTVAEMSAEAQLDEQIVPAVGAADEAQPGSLFLTGVTGFVGAFLCYELLQQSEADIYCLVRAADDVAGLRRVKENLAVYGLWQEEYGARLKVVAGDLAQPRFGLSAPVFDALARQVDRIWHCGAQVKWTYPYRALKAANVLGTHEVLRLASLGRATPVHFISTVGVLLPYDDRAAAIENDALEGSKALTIGYAQSKWIAEKLVRQAGARGLPVTIYRPATAGHSQSGVYNAHDHLPLLIKGCLQLGCAPELDMVVQVAPIDYVSKAMLWLAGQPGAAGQTYHLVNPHTLLWPEVVERIRMLGFRLPLIAYDEWQARLAEGVRADREQALYAMAPFFAAGGSPLVRLPRFDCQQTLAALAPSALYCPPLEGKLLKLYIDQFVRSGFLAHESMMRN